MVQKYKWPSALLLAAGVSTELVVLVILMRPHHNSAVRLAICMLGWVVYFWGCVLMAKAKGYSPVVAVVTFGLAFTCPLTLLYSVALPVGVLIALPDKMKSRFHRRITLDAGPLPSQEEERHYRRRRRRVIIPAWLKIVGSIFALFWAGVILVVMVKKHHRADMVLTSTTLSAAADIAQPSTLTNTGSEMAPDKSAMISSYFQSEAKNWAVSDAVRWLALASKQGDKSAQPLLDQLTQLGETNTQAMIDCIAAAADAGNPTAQWILGLCYSKGAGVAQDLSKAFNNFAQSASNGEVNAQITLGEAYLHGYGGAESNVNRGLTWLEKAATQGDSEAQYLLAAVYSGAGGVERDTAAMTNWLFKSFAHGNPKAIYRLGMSYMKGDGFEQNIREGCRLCGIAARAGIVQAQIQYADCLLRGNGTESNVAEAAKWLSKAAAFGDADSQVKLAYLYYRGNGVQRNLSESAKWAELAAMQGKAVAQNSIGYQYDQGEGVAQNLVEAYKWYRLAIMQNEPRAKVNMEKLRPRMTTEQIAEGEKRAKEFRLVQSFHVIP